MDVLLKEGITEYFKMNDDGYASKRTSLSTGCGKQGCFSLNEEELNNRRFPNEEFCLSRREGILQFQSSTAVLGLIKSCGKQKDLFHGTKLHADLLKTGLLTHNIYVGTALLSMYAKRGALLRAQLVFDELRFQDVALWNALINGYAGHGHLDAALSCYKQMQDEGIFPDSVTYICLFKACAKIGSKELGIKLHAEARLSGLMENNIILGTSLVNMYSKCGAPEKAQEVFDELVQRDVALWTALIAGYAQQGFDEKAFECFTQMQKEGFKPNVVTFVCILKSCGHAQALERGEEIHAKVKEQKLLHNNVMLGTALVDMYAKSGALGKARKVFDELSTRDVALWNALIAGYAQYELSAEAMACCKQMQEEGLSPDAITYTCLLKSCVDIKKGEEIHFEISRQGFLAKNIIISTALVDMYARCGSLRKAYEVFDELLEHDVMSWNVLMAGYAQHGYADQALHCLEQMQQEGLSPNAASFVSLLKACSSLGALEKGMEVHLKVSIQGILRGNITLGNALVDMYMKCGALSKAQDLFEELSYHNVASWNVLIAGYVQQGFNSEAISRFQQMQDLNIIPDVVTFVCVVKACGNLGALKMGEKMHAEVHKQGLFGAHIALGTAFVDMYCKCGAISKAQTLFDDLPAHDEAAWTALMIGYAQQGLNEEALRCFERMQDEEFSPNAATFACILKVCGSLTAIKKGEELHEWIQMLGLSEDNVELGSLLVDMYARCGFLEKAQKQFDRLPAHDITSWNSMIAGYFLHGLPEEVLRCYGQLQDQGFTPDAVTYICALQACSCTGAAEKGEKIYAQIESRKLLNKHIAIGTASVDMFAKCGNLPKAREVFDNISVHDATTWTALIAGYAHHGFGDEAVNCYGLMLEEGLLPDVVTYVCLLKACSTIGAMNKGTTVHGMISNYGSNNNCTVLGSALVDMYAKCGAIATAQEVFDEFTEHNVVSWTALMAGYAQLGEYRKVFSLLGQMLREQVEPNTITFVVLLNVCCHSGLLEEGQLQFYKMSTVYHFYPTMEHYNCIIDLYIRVGHWNEAVSVIQRVPSSDSLLLSSVLLGGDVNLMNPYLGGWALKLAGQSGEHLASANFE